MKRRLLIIDDDPAVLQVTAAALADLVDAEIELAATAREGIALLRDQQFDVVFTDLRLPDTSGEVVVEVTRMLCPGVPVVIITGVTEYLPRGDVWADFFLSKPFRLEALTKVLKDALARADAAKSAA